MIDRLFVASVWLVALSLNAAEPFRMLSTTAAVKTSAVLCLISWNATPPLFEVVHYSVYQATSVEGPYELISQTDTNEITLVVEAGTHFWNVRALSVWNGETNASAPSASVGTVESAPGGISMKKVALKRAPETSVPDALLVPTGATMPAPTNEAARPLRRSQALPVPTSDFAYIAPTNKARGRLIPARRAPAYSLAVTNVTNTTPPPPGARDPRNPNALPTP